MQNLTQVKRWRRAVDPAVELAGFDPTTGLAGRALLLERLERQWVWCTERQLALCLLLINIRRFSLIRKQRAEEVDAALIAVGQVVSDALRRRADFAGHIRAGEFSAILADVTRDGAEHVGGTIISAVREARIPMPGLAGGTVEVAVGGACYVPTANHFSKTLVTQADEALAEARKSSEDQAIIHGLSDKPDIARGGW